MRYLGGKARINKELSSVVNLYTSKKILYEPFCGGLWMTSLLSVREASDVSIALISLYQSIINGWEPPDIITEDDYIKAKELPKENPLNGFCGFACSFGAKYFQGYARGGDRNFALQAKNSIYAKLKMCKGVKFTARSYDTLNLKYGDAIYCDPPYEGVTSVYDAPKFNSTHFWEWCRIQANKGVLVLVSEYNAPNDFSCVYTIKTKLDFTSNRDNNTTFEKLFMLGKV